MGRKIVKKLVAYLTTGLEEKNFTIDLALNLKDNGVDILELGIPFSDPVADGEVIEKASLKALANGFKVDDIFDISSAITPKLDTLWMGYFNSFYKKGVEEFLKKASQTNISGMIIPDLPHEESLAYQKLFDQYQKSLITFVAPTDSNERIKQIVQNSSKFIYLVAYAGITGSGKSENLDDIVKNIKEYSSTDVYVGFGVNEDTAKEKAKGVDGVIVGSAFIKVMMNDSLNHNEKMIKICQMAKNIKDKIN
jgi:tryptophan synthase alpha chain